MSKEKIEQNRLILELRDQKKMSWQQILQELHRRGHSDLKRWASVKTKYYTTKNRQKGSVKKTEKKKITKAPSKQITKAPSQKVYKRATYYLTKEQVRDITILAARREIQKSELMRQIITEYLSKQSDL